MINTDFRPPVISGSEAQQLQQIRSYLYQLSEQLNFALSSVQKEQETVNAVVRTAAGSGEKKAVDNFEALKGLIIKSADIVNAYTEEINKTLKGEYVAVSEYGTFTKTVNTTLAANAESITQNIQAIEAIGEEIRTTQGYVRSGVIGKEDGKDIIGVEVGQTDGETEAYTKFARFTSDKLSFYQNGTQEVAYISNYKLHITSAEISDSLTLGKYRFKADASGSVIVQWIGGAANA